MLDNRANAPARFHGCVTHGHHACRRTIDQLCASPEFSGELVDIVSPKERASASDEFAPDGRDDTRLAKIQKVPTAQPQLSFDFSAVEDMPAGTEKLIGCSDIDRVADILAIPFERKSDATDLGERLDGLPREAEGQARVTETIQLPSFDRYA
jgi:hypothetical protein